MKSRADVAKLMDEIFSRCQTTRDAGQKEAVLLMPSGRDEDGLGRIVAMSTDRHRMAFYAAQWALSVRNTPPAKP